jgi:hypothetical protein
MSKKKSSKTKKLTKKQQQKKRSAAAKKGWETRRKREYEKRFARLNPELVGIEKEVERRVSERIEEQLKKRTAKQVTDELVRLGKLSSDLDTKIKARLRIVGGVDSADYYDEVLEIANDDEYLDYTPTEIYTMGFY